MTDLTPIYRIAGLGILVAVLNIFCSRQAGRNRLRCLALQE